MKVSKRVASGMLVTQLGGWICPYDGKRGKLLGVWTSGSESVIETDHGLVTVRTPRGIQKRGACSVKAAPLYGLSGKTFGPAPVELLMPKGAP